MAQQSVDGARLHWRLARRRLQRNAVLRPLLGQRRPAALLLLVAIITGTIAGLCCALLALGSHWLGEQLLGLPLQLGHAPAWLLLPLACILLTCAACALTHLFAPEAAGSGIPEIEGALQQQRELRWWRVLPVKVIGGIAVLGAHLPLGREGPSVHIGGVVGAMVARLTRLSQEGYHATVATGAAAGLAAAFNAPLAGVMFIMEEMRPQFRFSLIGMKSVFFGTIAGTIVCQGLIGQQAMIPLPDFAAPPLELLWLYLLLGLLCGLAGAGFNRLVVLFLDGAQRLHRQSLPAKLILAAFAGGVVGLLALFAPRFIGSGMEVMPTLVTAPLPSGALGALLLGKLILTLCCFALGVPGGIFAPLLLFGALTGLLFASAALPLLALPPELAATLAIAAMGGLLAATVRAPLTAVLLVIELSHNYQQILPLLISCLGATLVAQALGAQPIYSQLLARTLRLANQQPEAPAAITNPLDNPGRELIPVALVAVVSILLLALLVRALA